MHKIKTLFAACKIDVQVNCEKIPTWSFNVWNHKLELQVGMFPKSNYTDQKFIGHLLINYTHQNLLTTCKIPVQVDCEKTPALSFNV